MNHKIIEIKAQSGKNDQIRQILNDHHASFRGTDHQIDTYFNVNSGRLKLREGDIENSLIHYLRDNKESPKQSDVVLFKNEKESSLKSLLIRAMGVNVIVDKLREIYFIGNVKIHLDQVSGLGEFVEIEAIGNSDACLDDLQSQCEFYMNLFGIEKEKLISHSYSDMLLQKKRED